MSYTNEKQIITDFDVRSSVAEAYRKIRTNLRFTAVDKVVKTILVTSPGPKEGKSITVANLGTVMAQAGSKVIIVDCDLRVPEQHNIFGTANQLGVTDILTDTASITEVLQKTRISNLSVITSGLLPPNPSELLHSAKTKQMLDQLAEQADIILLDAPPTLIRSDAVVLSSLVDGVILVIKAGKTKREDGIQAKENLLQANAKILGAVMSDI